MLINPLTTNYHALKVKEKLPWRKRIDETAGIRRKSWRCEKKGVPCHAKNGSENMSAREFAATARKGAGEMLNWFKRDRPATVTVKTDSLAEIEEAYQLAKRGHVDAALAVRVYRATHKIAPEFFIKDNRAMIPVNANARHDPVLAELESQKEKARQRFTEKLRQRAEFLMRTGAVK
jgi:hypothetical protein